MGCVVRDHSVRRGVIQQNIFNRYKQFLHITAQWKQIHMLSHVLRMKVQGLICCARGPGLIGLTLAHGLCPVLSPDFLSYWSSPLDPSP